MKLLISFAIMFLPSSAKIALLRMMGATIGKGCYIGFSLIYSKEIEIGDYVRIGHFNLIHRLLSFSMAQGSKIESFNWITGAGTGSFFEGKNSAVRRFHFFEASFNVQIGANSVIAGRSSLFFTHGIAPDNMNDASPIVIGDWCYIGAAARFLPGSSLADGTFVGMGAVVTKEHKDEYCLIGGVPAEKKKELRHDLAFYNRPFLRHAHHPAEYTG